MRYPGTFWHFFHDLMRVNVNNSFSLSVPNTFQYKYEYFHYIFDFNDPDFNTPYGESLKMIWLIPSIVVLGILLILGLLFCCVKVYQKRKAKKAADAAMQIVNDVMSHVSEENKNEDLSQSSENDYNNNTGRGYNNNNSGNNNNNNNNNNQNKNNSGKRFSKKHFLCCELVLLILIFFLGFFIFHTIFIFFWPNYDTTIARYNKTLNDTNIRVENVKTNITDPIHSAYETTEKLIKDNSFLEKDEGVCVKLGVYDPMKDLYLELEKLKHGYEKEYDNLKHDFYDAGKALVNKQLDATKADPYKVYMWKLVVVVFTVVGVLIVLKYVLLMIKRYRLNVHRLYNNNNNNNNDNNSSIKKEKYAFCLCETLFSLLIFVSLYALWFGLWFESSANALFSDICNDPHGMMYGAVNATVAANYHRLNRMSILDYFLFDCKSFWYKTDYNDTIGNNSVGPITFETCNSSTTKYMTECRFVDLVEKIYMEGEALVIGAAKSKDIFDRSINSSWCKEALS